MYLLNCLDCHTIHSIVYERTYCDCRKAYARLVNHKDVIYTGRARILLIDPESYKHSLARRLPIKELIARVMPNSHNDITYVKQGD